MSGLDGLGWPNPEDEPIKAHTRAQLNKTMDNSEHQQPCPCAWCEVERQNAGMRAETEELTARRSAAACSPSSLTPETDTMASMRRATSEWVGLCGKLERERDEWQLHALMKMAVKQLACMWCGEIVHAPTGYEPGTPLSEEQREQAYREHVATCPKHPVAPLREALKFIATDKIATARDMRCRAARALESFPENESSAGTDASAKRS